MYSLQDVENILFLEVRRGCPLRNLWKVEVISIAYVSQVPMKVEINAYEEATVNPTSRQTLPFWKTQQNCFKRYKKKVGG
jgi:hypothetical protein